MVSIDIKFFSLHSRVVCNCGSCESKKQTLSEWERHTGCRAKKWKYSVKVKDYSMIPLERWVCSSICYFESSTRS